MISSCYGHPHQHARSPSRCLRTLPKRTKCPRRGFHEYRPRFAPSPATLAAGRKLLLLAPCSKPTVSEWFYSGATKGAWRKIPMRASRGCSYLTYLLSSTSEAANADVLADLAVLSHGVTSPSKFANRSSHHIQQQADARSNTAPVQVPARSHAPRTLIDHQRTLAIRAKKKDSTPISGPPRCKKKYPPGLSCTYPCTANQLHRTGSGISLSASSVVAIGLTQRKFLHSNQKTRCP